MTDTKKVFLYFFIFIIVVGFTSCSNILSTWEGKFDSYGAKIKVKLQFFKDNTFVISGTNDGEEQKISGIVESGDPTKDGDIVIVILSMTELGKAEPVTFTAEDEPHDIVTITGDTILLPLAIGGELLHRKKGRFL